MLIEATYPDLSMRHQCELLGINRSSLYYEPVTVGQETLTLMNLIDEEYTRHCCSKVIMSGYESPDNGRAEASGSHLEGF